MATTTPNFGLRKPTNTDTVNVVTDIAGNMDLLDAHAHSGTYVAYVTAPTGVAATDTANLIAAIAAIPSTGGTLYLQAGTYAINAVLNLPTDRPWWIRGAGMKSTRLYQANGSNLTAVLRYSGAVPGSYVPDNFDYLQISDLEVHGNKTNNATSTSGILLTGADYVSIRDVSVRDCKRYGLQLSNCDEVLLTGVFAAQNGTTDSDDAGIFVTGGSHDIHIVGAMCEVNTGAAIKFDGVYESAITGCNTWSNNYGVHLVSSYDNTITTNVFEDDRGHGILAEGAATTKNTIVANRCITPAIAGIRLNAAHTNQVIGNICDAGTGTGIHETSAADNNFVFGNQATFTRTGVGTQAYMNKGATGGAGSYPGQIPLKSGLYYMTVPTNATGTSAALGNGTLRATPFVVPNDVTLTRIGAEITSAGEAGSKVRLGIYADAGTGYPGALILDAGTINGDSATVQEITISQALAPGLYWVGAAVQVAPTTQPTVRITGTTTVQTGFTAIPGVNASVTGYSEASVTGALPASFTATVTSIGNAPRTFVKVS